MATTQLTRAALAIFSMAAAASPQFAGAQATRATSTPSSPAADQIRPAPRTNAAGETILTFENATVGKAIPNWTEGAVNFTLASAPQHSQAQGRIMFFPHLKTERRGILNAMANEQGIPVKAQIAGGASAVTLVLWGTIGCHAWLEAHDKDGKLLDRAALTDTVPRRKSPSDPIPSFELAVKGVNIAYVLFGGGINGGALVADEMRYIPMRPEPARKDKETVNHP